MAEYIEREALKKDISALETAGAFTESFKNAVLKIISENPAADVAEVRHGKWYYNEMHSDLGYSAYACSLCKKEVSIDEEDYKLNYCPYCGAKMDLE